MVSWELCRRISRWADATITLLLPCSCISSLISEVKDKQTHQKPKHIIKNKLFLCGMGRRKRQNSTDPWCPRHPPAVARTPGNDSDNVWHQNDTIVKNNTHIKQTTVAIFILKKQKQKQNDTTTTKIRSLKKVIQQSIWGCLLVRGIYMYNWRISNSEEGLDIEMRQSSPTPGLVQTENAESYSAPVA